MSSNGACRTRSPRRGRRRRGAARWSAPAARWRAVVSSWTPQTPLYALAAASSSDPEDRADAEDWLRWVDDHRTASGAIPEKVLADGSPAAVAPLSWSSALVVLALVELDTHGTPGGAG